MLNVVPLAKNSMSNIYLELEKTQKYEYKIFREHMTGIVMLLQMSFIDCSN